MKTAVQQVFSELEELHPNLFNVYTTEGKEFINHFHKYLAMEREQMIYIIKTYHNNLFYLPLSENGEADRILDLILTKQIKPKL
jgi:hypothetical protein